MAPVVVEGIKSVAVEYGLAEAATVASCANPITVGVVVTLGLLGWYLSR